MSEDQRRSGGYQYQNPFETKPGIPKHAATRNLSRGENIKNHLRSNLGLIITGVIIAAVLITAVIFVTGFLASPSTTIQVVKQPPTASEIAKNLGCTGFSDTGAAPAGGAITTGTCYISGVKYAIDTFVNSQIRDSWLKITEPMGVNPKWMTSTSVVYKSVKQ